MKLAFRRRTIHIPRWMIGEAIELKIPATYTGKSDFIALLVHVRCISRFTPDQISALYATRLGSMVCGTIRRHRPRQGKYPVTTEGYLQYLRDHQRRPRHTW